MKKSETIALVSGGVMGLIASGLLITKMSNLEKENTRLRVDNINLLRNTLVAIDALMDNKPVPGEVVNDIEFRRMAFLVEYEDVVEEEEN